MPCGSSRRCAARQRARTTWRSNWNSCGVTIVDKRFGVWNAEMPRWSFDASAYVIHYPLRSIAQAHIDFSTFDMHGWEVRPFGDDDSLGSPAVLPTAPLLPNRDVTWIPSKPAEVTTSITIHAIPDEGTS